MTGVVESAGKLWMSTIEFPAVACIELDGADEITTVTPTT